MSRTQKQWNAIEGTLCMDIMERDSMIADLRTEIAKLTRGDRVTVGKLYADAAASIIEMYLSDNLKFMLVGEACYYRRIAEALRSKDKGG